jgi:hypothetical protein
MLQKNIDKQKRKERKTWTGLFTRKTPTKIEKQRKINKKYVNKHIVDKYLIDKY